MLVIMVLVVEPDQTRVAFFVIGDDVLVGSISIFAQQSAENAGHDLPDVRMAGLVLL